MQYGFNVNTGENLKNTGKLRKTLWMKTMAARLITVLIMGVLLGRVNLLLNQSDSHGIAPFGMAYLIVIGSRNNMKKIIASSVGVIIGYLTINNSLTDGMAYLISAGMLFLYYVILRVANKKQKDWLSFSIVLISFIAYGFITNKYELGVNVTLSLLEVVVIIPIYYVINYAINSIKESNSNYFFSSEEIVSMGILFCLLIAGFGNIDIFGQSIENILALSTVLMVAYIGGATYGAMIGVCMGVILGASSNNMMACVGLYGIGGLIVGIFKDTGKIFSILSGVIIYVALGLYSEDLTLNLVIEICLSSIIFLCIPKKVYRSIEVEINPDKKRENLNKAQLNGIKEEFTLKLKSLNSALFAVSQSLNSIRDNENLLIKSKSSAMVENLADRCCSKCINKSLCWERDFHQTYNSFEDIIKSFENGKVEMPQELDKKCIKGLTLLKNAETIINNYSLNEKIRERLLDGKQLLSEHINNISNSLESMLEDFRREVTISMDLERIVKRGLNKNLVDYNDIFCYTDINGRIKIRLTMQNCEGANYCGKTLLPIINNIMRIPMAISSDGCNINPLNNECTIVFQETPKYSMISYSAMGIKSGESKSGDNYSFGKSIEGCYTTILSDGMGSGPEASEESKATVNLVEKFMESGFDENVTVNTVNSIMGMRFAETERYSTLDLNKVDLYTGEAKFIKIGAAPTFIKRGNEIKNINSKNLPFTLVDEIEVDIKKEDLKAGDILVSVSDGVLDIDKMNSGNFIWLEEFLKDCSGNPKELSGQILEKARELSGGVLKDDMTVVVSKLYSV